jgi:hypothetical protein
MDGDQKVGIAPLVTLRPNGPVRMRSVTRQLSEKAVAPRQDAMA